MEEPKRQEHRFELRSEKVRSIVGQIPSSLIRYGITAIGMVLLCLFAVARFLPYKQVYSGTATVHAIAGILKADSIETTIFLKFGDKRPNAQTIKATPITLQSIAGTATGTVLHLSAIRDTLGRQEALCHISLTELRPMENNEVDFILTCQSGNLLDRFFSGLLRK